MAGPGTPDIAYELDAKRENVTLTIGSQRLDASAVELEKLVQFLGMIRANMLPAVETDVPPKPFLQIDTPNLSIGHAKDRTHVGLLVRTSPYGWIGFNFDRPHAEAVARHLADAAARLDAPKPAS
jgi:hypothetical protein